MERSLDSMKTYLVVWLSGVFAGLILVERWRRLGARSAAARESAWEAAESAVASSAPTAPPEKQNAAALIFAGARADARRAQHVFTQAMPWGNPSDPSTAELRRWSRATPSADAQ